jgi:DnaJ-class molecular chaperone
VYDYEPGPRGWMPFTCPTCGGDRQVTTDGERETCFTCRGTGLIDPANPPRDTSTRGFLRDVWRIFFGG